MLPFPMAVPHCLTFQCCTLCATVTLSVPQNELAQQRSETNQSLEILRERLAGIASEGNNEKDDVQALLWGGGSS